MTDDPARQQRLAVLIDAENASAKLIAPILDEIANLGIVSVRRIYGDFTNPQMAPWRNCLLEHSIQPIQQFRAVAGKGASDSALIIDAMDLLYTRRLDGFCIVSSDSDFTRLATRLREDGCRVFGFGEEKTPKSFRQACDKFFFVEIFRTGEAKAEAETEAAPKVAAKAAKPLVELDRAMLNILGQAVSSAEDEQGRSNLSYVGNLLAKRMPEFDSRNYGFKKLVDLFAARAEFKVIRISEGDGRGVYIARADMPGKK